MAFFNSYILYNKNNIEKKQNYTEYRLQIAEALLQDYKRRGQFSNGDTAMRLHAQHLGPFFDEGRRMIDLLCLLWPSNRELTDRKKD